MTAFSIIGNNRGSAMIVSLLLLVVLTLLGIIATTTSTFELQISSNDKLYKTSFYAADAGTEMTCELIEQNIDERDWNDDIDVGDVRVVNGDFYLNREGDTPDAMPSDTNRDAFLPRNYAGNAPHTNIKVRGNAALSTGSAIQLAAGYEGKGKGAAGGGAWITYDVRAQHRNVRNSAVGIRLGWRHVM